MRAFGEDVCVKIGEPNAPEPSLPLLPRSKTKFPLVKPENTAIS